MAEVIQGDCLEILKNLPDNSVDAIVTDPPAGIAFMGKDWDKNKGGRDNWIAWMSEVAAECLRVIKPGGHALVWAIPRTSHWTGTAWENAGWECRDKIFHCFSSGFPKSLDVSKAIDRAAGAEREVIGVIPDRWTGKGNVLNFSMGRPQSEVRVTGCPATPEAKQWAGWGTALKPAVEEWWLFRKPLIGTVAENVLAHGTGAINVDGTRIRTDWENEPSVRLGHSQKTCSSDGVTGWGKNKMHADTHPQGRWPAHLIHDGSDEIVMLLGDATRFFYCAKASKRDRGEGNNHVTVKATELMRYLCRLITPPGGIILDPFCGSGSTGKAAILEGFRFIGIEREAEYVAIAKERINNAKEQVKMEVKQTSLFES